MLDWVFGQELLDLLVGDLQELKRRLDDSVKQEGEVYEQSKAKDLEPLESFPTQA